jgi:pyruvate,orthophosphate dikinase
MGKACVAGAEGITVDVRAREAVIGDKVLSEGDVITIDGSNGNVYIGEVPTIPPEFSDEMKTLLSWADEVAQLKVLANADTPEAAEKAVEFGAMGIGLCRTERMFNEVDRLPIVVDMILANTTEERQTFLNKLLPIQREDFKAVFKTLAPHPVTVRLLDPPLHEFLPTEIQLIEELENLRSLRRTILGAKNLLSAVRMTEGQPNNFPPPFDEMGEERINNVIIRKEQMLRKVRELYEVNPMLGHRGVRLGITYPEIYAMQIRAILEATAECVKEGADVHPEIMIPQVTIAQELKTVKKIVDNIRAEVETSHNIKLDFKFGSMIEVVRACMRAEQLAEVAEFFSLIL